jgi:hypothetical protein
MATVNQQKVPQISTSTEYGQIQAHLWRDAHGDPHILGPKMGIPIQKIFEKSDPAQSNGMNVGLV